MTLVLSAHSRDSLWLMVDRRLSAEGRRPVDDAVKVMSLDTTDGVGLLGYAGLGRTKQQTQPSNWMSAVLRGRSGLTFEQTLGILAVAANNQLPHHLAQTQAGEHFIVVPAFVRGVGGRLYSIDIAVDPQTAEHQYRYTSVQRTDLPGAPCVRLAMSGTGGVYLHRNLEVWRRDLLHLLRAHDRGKVSDLAVADWLALLNYRAHKKVSDTVGPRCIVAWRRRPDAPPGRSGGGQQTYIGVDRDRYPTTIPTIASGRDIAAISGVIMRQLRRGMANGASLAQAAINVNPEVVRRLAELPEAPDEQLR